MAGRYGQELRFSSLRWNDKVIFDSNGTMTVPTLVVENASVGCLNNPILTDKVGSSRTSLNQFFEYYTGLTTEGTFSIPREYWIRNYESAGAVILLNPESSALLKMPNTIDSACVAQGYFALLRVHFSFLVTADIYYNGWVRITVNLKRNGNTVSSSSIKLKNIDGDAGNYPATLTLDDTVLVQAGDELDLDFDYQSSDMYKGIFITDGHKNTYGNIELSTFLTQLND